MSDDYLPPIIRPEPRRPARTRPAVIEDARHLIEAVNTVEGLRRVYKEIQACADLSHSDMTTLLEECRTKAARITSSNQEESPE